MILKTLFLHPLGPALCLALGSVLLWLGDRLSGWQIAARRTGRVARVRLAFTLAWIVVTAATLVWLRVPPVRAVLRWTWQPLTVAGSALEWRLDGWNWLAALLILLLTAATLLLDGFDGAPRSANTAAARSAGSAARTLALAAAATAFVFANNVITLATCAMLLDVALALRLRPGRNDETAGRAWALLTVTGWLLLVLLALLGEDGIRIPLAHGIFPQIDLTLLWLVALIRAGVYPFHLWLTGSHPLAAEDRLALHLIGPATGLWLLGRVHQATGANGVHRPEWAALGALALLGTALAAWAADDEGLRWRWLALNRASLVVMAAYVAAITDPLALTWPLISFCLGTALLAVGQTTLANWGWRLPGIFAALALWGIPGTPGFLARTVLIYPTDLATAVPLFVVILVAETLLTAALWQAAGLGQRGREPDDPRGPTGETVLRLSLALGLLAAPVIAWGLWPGQLASLTGLRAAEAVPTLPALLAQARRSVWVGLFLAGIGGVILGLLRERILAQVRGWQQGIVAVVSLEWIYRAVAAGLTLAGNGLQYFATLGEGEGYLGWLALAALILWVLLRG